MSDDRYEYLIGKTYHDIEARLDVVEGPIHFAQCGCGLLLLTKPAGDGSSTECGSCRFFRENYGAMPGASARRAPIGNQSAMIVVSLLVVLAFGWLGVSMWRVPDRPVQMEAAE